MLDALHLKYLDVLHLILGESGLDCKGSAVRPLLAPLFHCCPIHIINGVMYHSIMLPGHQERALADFSWERKKPRMHAILDKPSVVQVSDTNTPFRNALFDVPGICHHLFQRLPAQPAPLYLARSLSSYPGNLFRNSVIPSIHQFLAGSPPGGHALPP